jgi:hypothetical protein
MEYQHFPHTEYYLASNDNDALRRQKAKHERQVKQQIQYEMGTRLSKIDKAEYGDDILEYMLESEVRVGPRV